MMSHHQFVQTKVLQEHLISKHYSKYKSFVDEFIAIFAKTSNGKTFYNLRIYNELKNNFCNKFSDAFIAA